MNNWELQLCLLEFALGIAFFLNFFSTASYKTDLFTRLVSALGFIWLIIFVHSSFNFWLLSVALLLFSCEFYFRKKLYPWSKTLLAGATLLSLIFCSLTFYHLENRFTPFLQVWFLGFCYLDALVLGSVYYCLSNSRTSPMMIRPQMALFDESLFLFEIILFLRALYLAATFLALPLLDDRYNTMLRSLWQFHAATILGSWITGFIFPFFILKKISAEKLKLFGSSFILILLLVACSLVTIHLDLNIFLGKEN